jgi:hypothetical protein
MYLVLYVPFSLVIYITQGMQFRFLSVYKEVYMLIRKEYGVWCGIGKISYHFFPRVETKIFKTKQNFREKFSRKLSRKRKCMRKRTQETGNIVKYLKMSNPDGA